MDFREGIANTCPDAVQGVTANLFLTLINALVVSKCSLDRQDEHPPDYAPKLRDGDEFDFIVVGSGSAGSVVAHRLSEVPQWKVLLLEAGGYPIPLTEIPALAFSAQDSANDWQYKMETSDSFGEGLRNRESRVPRGKGVGGSSLLNAMLYVRGNKRDFNDWAALGNPGWDYESVLKYFRKNEGVQVENARGHGRDGILKIGQYTSTEPVRQMLGRGYESLGLTNDYTSDHPLGYIDSFMTVVNGTRQSTGKAFIQTAKDRKNLFVALNSQVGKVVIKNHKVVGVEVKVNGKIMKVNSKKEVILSGGAINSPQILMNSGVGPKEHLESVGIKTVKNLPVGKDFQDHLVNMMFVDLPRSAAFERTDKEVVDDLYQYFMHRRGPLGELSITNLMAFMNTRKDSEYPNIQVHHFLHPMNDAYTLPSVQHLMGFNAEVSAVQVEHNKKAPNVLIAPTLLNPKSRGKLLLRSSDPYDKPLIVHNFLSDEEGEDLQITLEGIKAVEKMLESEAFNGEAKIVELPLPSCKKYAFKSDDYWRCYIHNLSTNLFHPTSTCKMGPKTDPLAVVDARLKVYGLEGIRVVDGSIMPLLTSGNTNAPCIMIGEKGSEMIKEDWANKRDEL